VSKTKLTLEIEKALCNKANKNCDRYALEVPVPNGICDFVSIGIDYRNHGIPIIRCYEIKISYSDFKSKNGHNFVGDFNYYVVPEKLYNEKIHNKEYLRGVGLIVYKNGKFYEKVNSLNVTSLSLDKKFRLMDTMLMRWTNGGMYKSLQSLGCDLRNFEQPYKEQSE
jgi:hypothetical protein